MNSPERFWVKVEKSPDGCWLWTGCTGATSPYGLTKWDGLQTTAHRVAYILAIGPIPDGKVICHRCDNPLCVNPDHLFAATQRENVQDCIRKGRAARGKALNHRRQDGQNNHNAKLTDVQVEEIRQKHKGGATQGELAEEYGVTRANIWCIVRNKSRVR